MGLNAYLILDFILVVGVCDNSFIKKDITKDLYIVSSEVSVFINRLLWTLIVTMKHFLLKML